MGGFRYRFIIKMLSKSPLLMEDIYAPLSQSLKIFYPEFDLVFTITENKNSWYDFSFNDKKELELLKGVFDYEELEKYPAGLFHIKTEADKNNITYISIIDGNSNASQLLFDDKYLYIIAKCFSKGEIFDEAIWACDPDYESIDELFKDTNYVNLLDKKF